MAQWARGMSEGRYRQLAALNIRQPRVVQRAQAQLRSETA
jgi:hypothetical protein